MYTAYRHFSITSSTNKNFISVLHKYNTLNGDCTLPLYGSGTVFHSIPHLLRHFPSSAHARRHTSSNSVTHNYCCHAREMAMSYMDTLITLTCLLNCTTNRYIPAGTDVRLSSSLKHIKF